MLPTCEQSAVTASHQRDHSVAVYSSRTLSFHQADCQTVVFVFGLHTCTRNLTVWEIRPSAWINIYTAAVNIDVALQYIIITHTATA